MSIFVNWLVAAIAIMITAYLLPGVQVTGLIPALVTAVILGLINATLKPLLLVLTLPVNIATLGLFTFVINALLILLTSAVVPGFEVHGFGWAILFSIVLFLVQAVLYQFRSPEKPGQFHN